MNISLENIDELNGIIRLSIEPADYEAKVEESLKNYRKQVNIPGFRPGKVPAGMVKKMYGKQAIAEEVNKALSTSLMTYIREEKLNILGEPLPNEELQPKIDWDNDTTFDFVFDIGIAPEVSVKLDKRSKYPFYTIAVSDAMIDQQVEQYTTQFGENKDVEVIGEKDVARGSFVQLNEEGNAKEDGISTEMSMISVDVIKDEEIKKSIVGLKIGEDVTFDINKAYPSESEIAYILNIEKEEAANVTGNFKFSVKEVSQFVAAEVNEDLFKKIYGDDTAILDVETFRNSISEEIKKALVSSSDYKFGVDAKAILMKKLNISVPEEFMKRWLIATNENITAEDIEKEFDMFIEDMKWQLIRDQIAKDNEVKVENEELVAAAKDMARMQFRQYGMMNVEDEHLEGFAKQMLAQEQDRNRLYAQKMEEKIMEVIKGKVSVDEKEVSREEFEEMLKPADA